MMIDVSTKSYMVLCAMVREAIEDNTDANPLLEQVAAELAAAVAPGNMPDEIRNNPRLLAALQQAGFVGDRAA